MKTRTINLDKSGKPKISESQFLSQVIDLAHAYKWKVAHFRPAQTRCRDCKGQGCSSCGFTGKSWRTAVQGDGKGFPDLVLAKKGKIIFAELKTETGKVSPEQIDWFLILQSCDDGDHCSMMLWRPSDYADIEKILKGQEAP